ncbi:MAG: radical SAM protein [Chloroflexota bacterium]|nr:radical SAM protein [Chloroflexota bacterium]
MYASVHTDRSGRAFVSDDHTAAAMDGAEAVPFAEGIPLPAGSELVPLARDAVAYDRAGRPRPLGKGRLALAAVLPPDFVRHLFPAYRDEEDAAPLEALPYSAVAADDKGELVVAAERLRENETLAEDRAGGGPAARATVRDYGANTLARQLARCARENACEAARAGLGRGVLPVPLGAPPAEKPRLPVALRSGYAGAPTERAAFRPDAREVVAVASGHLERGGTAIAFGRACDGEPLALVRVLEEAITGIRERSPGADVRLETSAPDPAALRRALDAGLGAITVRLGSARPDTYETLHGPIAHRWSDVRASLQLAAERDVRITIALLVLPGLTDRPAEVDALVALLGELPGGHVELRDLGSDPLRALRAFRHGAAGGIRALLARIAEADHFRVSVAHGSTARAG